MDLRSRSSRSRSKTPFLLTEGTQLISYENKQEIIEEETTHTYSTRSRNAK